MDFTPPTTSRHRLGRGLPGYLILFAPHAFVHERQCYPRGLPSPSVFLHISTHFTATRGILPPLTHSSHTVSNAVPRLSPGISHLTYMTACARFTPSNSDYRLHPTYYRGCWHVVSRCLFFRYRH